MFMQVGTGVLFINVGIDYPLEPVMELVGQTYVRQFRVKSEQCLFERPDLRGEGVNSTQICYPALDPFQNNWQKGISVKLIYS